MFAVFQNHALTFAALLLIADLACWRLLPENAKAWRVLLRLGFFLAYSLTIIDAGMSPLQPPPWSSAALNMLGSVLGIAWWLLCARTLTVVMDLILLPHSGHKGRLLNDVLGAVVFLVAIVAAAAYVMQLPVKGLLATSGVVAIVLGLALQNTLSDVFSGIVLNTTKPYRLGDWISIDGTEGKVIEIDWRATHLMTTQGGTAVIPNSVAAKAKILNLNRTTDIQNVAISISVPAHIRPRLVLDALHRTTQGVSALLPSPAAKASFKSADLTVAEYEISGFVGSDSNKGEVRNLLIDLAYRHLKAAGIQLGGDLAEQRRDDARSLLEDVKIFRSLRADEKDQLSQHMLAQSITAGQVLLDFDELTDSLLVIATGVVSASLKDGSGVIEAGRMGPGEVMGEEGIALGTPSQARFTALTSGLIYRIEKDMLQTCLNERSEVGTALTKLQRVRQQNSASVLSAKPVTLKKGGFLGWLKR